MLSAGPGLYWLDSALLLVSAALFAAGSLLWQSRGAWPRQLVNMRQLLQHRHLVLTLGLLYFSQGIPIGIAMDALPTLLRHDGASSQALAFLPLNWGCPGW